MPRSTISIIGTGLIGTSLGLVLTGRQDRTYDVVGADRDRSAAREAKRRGAIDRDVGSLQEAVEGAGLIILAVPVVSGRRLLQDIACYVQPGAIITDTCSTKADIMRWAAEFLPETVHFIGGHPMAGSEKSGPAAARADLFKDATWAITPSPRADEDAVRVVLGLIEAAGAYPLYIDPAEHDQYAAAVSHLPMLVSVALFRLIRDSQAWEDMALLSGPAFRDLTRLASGDPVMSQDIVTTNREAILHWLGRFRDEIDRIRELIDEGGKPVAELLGSSQLDRDAFLLNPPVRRRPEGPPLPSSQDAMGRLFLGGLYDRMKEMPTRIRPMEDDQELRRKLGARGDDKSG
jgi:prephenate dehydrogenase